MGKCFDFRDSMRGLKAMCKLLYTLPGCGAGGPLHILLDDDNYDTNSIMFCLKECLEYEDDRVRTLGMAICTKYLDYDLEERATFDSYWCGQDLECCYECANCDIRGELYEFMLEKEKK